MFTEQAVVHASQSLTSLTISPNPQSQQQYQQTKQSYHQQQQQHHHHHHHHRHHHSHSPHHHSAASIQQQNNHQNHKQNNQAHTLPPSLATTAESTFARRNSIVEHCSCGLSFKVDKNTNNIISSSTSLLALNTIYNENPGLIDQTINQVPYLTQSQTLQTESKKQQHPVNKYYHHQQQQQHQHAQHCHHHQTLPTPLAPLPTPPSAASLPPALAPPSKRYQPTEPPEIHTDEYFSQESQQQTINTSTTTTIATPHAHGCRHSHVHAQTEFSYGSR